MKKLAVFVLITVLSCGMYSLPVLAEDVNEENITGAESVTEEVTYRGTGKGEAILADLIFLRPVGFASIGVGFAATIVSFPFSIIANNTREVGDALLGETMNYTFVRPLGDNYQPLPLSEQK